MTKQSQETPRVDETFSIIPRLPLSYFHQNHYATWSSTYQLAIRRCLARGLRYCNVAVTMLFLQLSVAQLGQFDVSLIFNIISADQIR